MSGSALFETFARAPISFERGEGCWLVETNGGRYLDFAGGIAVNSLGHAHPHLVEALTEQAGKLWHVSNLYRIPGQERLAERLVASTFADKVFFTNSGAEALECAIKTADATSMCLGTRSGTARLPSKAHSTAARWRPLRPEDRRNIWKGSDPRSRASIRCRSTTSMPWKSSLGLRRLRSCSNRSRARAASASSRWPRCAGCVSFATSTALLLIFDEVQCGIGRTGKLFAYERTGIVPDIMAIAKGIGGGFPVGACLATEEAAKGMTPGVHGTTFGGNPLAMAVGNAVLDVVLADDFLDEVSRKALLFKQGLAAIADEFPDVIEDIRGFGLMLGVKCRIPNTKMVAALRDEKLLTVGAGDNVVRLLPPLIVSDDEIRDALDRIRAASEKLAVSEAA